MSISSTKAHADLPPSSSDKWLYCHGWLALNRGLPNETSAAAAEGTEAHEVLESVLRGTLDLDTLKDNEMHDYLSSCLEWLFYQPGVIHPELRMDFGSTFGFVDLFGTSDVVIDHPEHLTVADLKYGMGLVEVEGNTQLLTYLSAAVEQFGPRERYRLAILQPRAYHPQGTIREWWLTHRELEEFRVLLGDAISRNYNRGKPTAGDHCRKYCKAQGSCPALARHSLELFRSTPE